MNDGWDPIHHVRVPLRDAASYPQRGASGHVEMRERGLLVQRSLVEETF